MQFSVKMHDVQPGEVFAPRAIDSAGCEVAAWKVLRHFMDIPKEAWLVSVEIKVEAMCVVKEEVP